MRFYTNLDKFDIDCFKRKSIYQINHTFFYLCLLPYELKIEVLNSVNDRCKEIYNDILKIKSVFSDNIENSDYVILPYLSIMQSPYKFFSLYCDELELAWTHGKKVLYFYGGDDNIKFNVPYHRGYVFRNSGFFSEKFDNVFSIPTFSQDYFDKTYLKKNLSLSFCGYPKSSSEGISIGSKYFGIREDILNQLSDLDYVDFIIRTSWNNWESIEEKSSTIETSINDYIQNLKNNLYCLCVRGGGNYSFRLGETFMMGRIPVLINTDCILPFYDIIDYKRNTVYVDEKNSKNFTDIDSVIRKFHESHSEEELIQIQKENRKIWEKYFNPLSTFKYICSLLTKESI
jgi:hypothetical protein